MIHARFIEVGDYPVQKMEIGIEWIVIPLSMHHHVVLDL
jgi:hypothetical protein